jgi:HSP20 family molecular chaperone IbpA
MTTLRTTTFDNLVRSAFYGAPTTSPVPAAFSPAVESHRDGDDAVIRFELPGVDVEKDVTLEVKGRLLLVSGERRDERSDEDGSRRLAGRFSEFRYGSFRRTFRLAPQVTSEAVSASYDAGVLTLRVTGAYAEAEGQQVAISTGTPIEG